MKVRTLMCLSVVALLTLITLAAQAQTFSVIHSFQNGTDGSAPYAGVTLRNGVLYGTTFNGGNYDCGVVYQGAPSGSGWMFKPIYIFQGGQYEPYGCAPYGRVVFGTDGHLYGTATSAGPATGGLVFELVPPLSATCKSAACFWKQNILYAFPQFSGDSLGPNYEDLVWDSQGNIYGMTVVGGKPELGTVFEMAQSGNQWTEAPLHSFSFYNDAYPQNGVVLDGNGNIFGVTNGAVFELSYVQGSWQETVIHWLNPPYDGGSPYAGLIMDSSGNLFGATSTGGPNGGGTVFEMTPNPWQYKVLYSFSGSSPSVIQSLTMDAAGNLYGTTYYGGAYDAGSVFKLTKSGDTWQFSDLHDFQGGVHDGSSPSSQVTIGPDGTLYGTTTHGGQGDWGTVWMIKP